MIGYNQSRLPDLPTDIPILPPTTLAEAVAALNPRDCWAVHGLKSKDEGKSVAELIRTGKAIQVSDGSGGDDQTTSAFILTSRKKKAATPVHPVSGGNFTPGHPDDQHSYRGELAGAMGGVVTIQLLCDMYSIKEGSIEIGLDGEEAMKSIFALEDPRVDAPCYDLILDIRRKIDQLPIKVTGRHIKGHQDDIAHRSTLDRWANLNIDMDTKAKALLAKAISKGIQKPNTPFGNESLFVTFRGEKLSRIDMNQLYTDIYGGRTKQYWIDRHNIPCELIDSIDWEAQDKAYKREPHGKHRWLIKHLCGQCAVGRVMLRRKHQSHDRCPRCDAPDESVTHVLRCQAVSARESFQNC